MNEHEYFNKSDGLIIVHPRTHGRRVPGDIWCWAHCEWEEIPDFWLQKEFELRGAILSEWRTLKAKDLRKVFVSDALRNAMIEYQKWRWWRLPDWDDRYSVFRYIENLKRMEPIE